ncbi:outer membrane protein assembly factor BamE [Ramlibacter sp. PS3R-8]|uniref:outer membrane protein assembly factor BamE n=1 Tax=Ramlibacter sp. PS3R-8 TaxID=3133437 RepID=UPI0030AF5181
MPVMLPRQSRLILLAAAVLAALAGCGTLTSSARITTALTPYRIEIVQGNFVSKEQVDALQKGMSRDQVRQVLGTPLVTSVFHGERWDYVFTLKRQGVEPQQRRLTVYFQGDTMDRAEGDTMPSEAEFVTALDNRRKGGKVPRLEATEAELQSFDGKRTPAAAVVDQPVTAAPANYPPLETPR